MTEAASLKERCKTVMEAHLKTKGFPNMTHKAILNELPALWKALDAVGLTEELKAQGHTFGEFCQRASDKSYEASIFEKLQEAASGKFTRKRF